MAMRYLHLYCKVDMAMRYLHVYCGMIMVCWTEHKSTLLVTVARVYTIDRVIHLWNTICDYMHMALFEVWDGSFSESSARHECPENQSHSTNNVICIFSGYLNLHLVTQIKNILPVYIDMIFMILFTSLQTIAEVWEDMHMTSIRVRYGFIWHSVKLYRTKSQTSSIWFVIVPSKPI